MNSRRTAKVAELVREVVSTTILFGLKDPRIKNVTVTAVDVSGDLRSAKVYVSIMGDDRTQSLCLHGLNSARGFLQSRLADELQLRYTPVLRFELDDGVKNSVEASRILREVLNDQDSSEAPSEDDPPEESLTTEETPSDPSN